MKHCGTQVMETPRLLLRAFVDDDCEHMIKNWISNPKVQFEYGEPIYTTKSQVQALLNEWKTNYATLDFYRWAIIEKECSENIGQIAFCRVYADCKTAEIEYCIGEKFWGNGYALEALSAVIDFTFLHTDFHKLEAFHHMDNIASGRVLQKSAMHVTDNVQRFIRQNILPEKEVCYCVTKS